MDRGRGRNFGPQGARQSRPRSRPRPPGSLCRGWECFVLPVSAPTSLMIQVEDPVLCPHPQARPPSSSPPPSPSPTKRFTRSGSGTGAGNLAPLCQGVGQEQGWGRNRHRHHSAGPLTGVPGAHWQRARRAKLRARRRRANKNGRRAAKGGRREGGGRRGSSMRYSERIARFVGATQPRGRQQRRQPPMYVPVHITALFDLDAPHRSNALGCGVDA